MASREPARTQRQRHAETGARNAQQHAHGQQVVEALHEEEAEQHRHRDQAHLDQRGVLAADVLREDAERKAHERTRDDGHRQHQPLLRRRKIEGFADERRHGAVEHPDAAGEREVQKGREQRRAVA
jgi:hypothetical protein